MSAVDTVKRLIDATNRHDLDGLVGCFADDYRLEAPNHPARGFEGSARVRQNWETIFAAVPDIEVALVRTATDGDAVWTEQEMRGTRRDGAQHLMRGVFVFGVAGDLIRWGRMYLEPVDEGSPSLLEDLRQVAKS